MDNSNTRTEASSIFETLAAYEPYPAFRHVDIREPYAEPLEGLSCSWEDLTDKPFISVELSQDDLRHYELPYFAYDEPPTIRQEDAQLLRGYRSNNLIVDEWSGLNSTDTWFDPSDYKVVFRDGHMLFEKKKEAPDFGELSPSQELNDFVDTLVQGE